MGHSVPIHAYTRIHSFLVCFLVRFPAGFLLTLTAPVYSFASTNSCPSLLFVFYVLPPHSLRTARCLPWCRNARACTWSRARFYAPQSWRIHDASALHDQPSTVEASASSRAPSESRCIRNFNLATHDRIDNLGKHKCEKLSVPQEQNYAKRAQKNHKKNLWNLILRLLFYHFWNILYNDIFVECYIFYLIYLFGIKKYHIFFIEII